MRTADRISRVFHRLGLLYAAIPVLAGIYVAYELARGLEQQGAIDWLTIVIASYCLVWAFRSSWRSLSTAFLCGRIIRCTT